MNKSELIASMAEKSKLTKKDAEVALKAFIESVEEALEKGEKVQLVGFGTFETRERAAREGRNPRTKEVIKIASSRLPNLTSDKTMVFYLTNLKTVKFFDRKQMEIARSTEAGFKANKTYIRAIERYDVKANPEEKIKGAKIEA